MEYWVTFFCILVAEKTAEVHVKLLYEHLQYKSEVLKSKFKTDLVISNQIDLIHSSRLEILAYKHAPHSLVKRKWHRICEMWQNREVSLCGAKIPTEKSTHLQ